MNFLFRILLCLLSLSVLSACVHHQVPISAAWEKVETHCCPLTPKRIGWFLSRHEKWKQTQGEKND